MKLFITLFFILICSMLSHAQGQNERYIFFLHNRFLETHELSQEHPTYGRVEFREILAAFERAGFTVISQHRNGNVNARVYARGIVHQIDSLLHHEVSATCITVVGTSKGGYIAQYVSTLAQQSDINYAFVASYRDEDLTQLPEINYCGRILNIYEASDPFGVSAVARKNRSTCAIRHYKDLELKTGLGHGFLFKALPEWIDPIIRWASENYN